MKQERQLVEKILRAFRFTVPSPFDSSSLSSRRSNIKQAAGRALGVTRRGSASIRLGPGDDAAILSASRKSDVVLSCDAFIEGVHFQVKTHPPDSVGYKSLARATSDLAAMGASPRFFLLTLALPKSLVGPWLDGFLKGMARASRELGIAVMGGDTTVGPTVSVSITVLGEVAPGAAVGRSGARPGDLIYVSGKLGRAQLGLELVLAGAALHSKFRSEVRSHLYPKIQIELGAWLAKNHVATGMLDISDGLSTDLARLCAASHVGAKIYADKIPCVTISAEAATKLRRRKLDSLRMALHGGEDYELLFTVSSRNLKRLRNASRFSALTAIGEITPKKKITLIDQDGEPSPLKPLGWDPFKNQT
jgi:thiamine-monophosphate kinase